MSLQCRGRGTPTCPLSPAGSLHCLSWASCPSCRFYNLGSYRYLQRLLLVTYSSRYGLRAPYNWDSGLGMGVRGAMGGEWGIRALKDSPARKDFNFRRMCCLINAFGRFGRESCKKDVTKNTFEAVMCMKTNKYKTKCLEQIRTFMSKIRTLLPNRHELCRNSGRICYETTNPLIALTRAEPPHHNGSNPVEC